MILLSYSIPKSAIKNGNYPHFSLSLHDIGDRFIFPTFLFHGRSNYRTISTVDADYNGFFALVDDVKVRD